MAPENKKQVLELVEKQWHLSDGQAIETYALIEDHVWYEADAAF
jgi:hypothetical protein